jgi:NCS1 family nucleobase:cation symporter-1
VDYYKISRDRLDIPALYNPDGRYGRWNAAALVSYGIGVLVQIPFLAQALYTGPITRWLGGADISWIVGIAVTLAIYYPWAKATNRAPAESVYPDGIAENVPLPAAAKR